MENCYVRYAITNFTEENMQIDKILYDKMPPELQKLFSLQDNPSKEEVTSQFPNTKSGVLNAGHKQGSSKTGNSYAVKTKGTIQNNYGNDEGSAARFFYCAKTSKADRDEGMTKAEEALDSRVLLSNAENRETSYKNNHPTVKPTALMQYLIRLVTPKGGTVLDPYMGSGSTGKAAAREGMSFIGMEMSPEYFAIAETRIKHEYENQKGGLDNFFD
jgi:site-specific DNA-methyltransferase (adenine-specific)